MWDVGTEKRFRDPISNIVKSDPIHIHIRDKYQGDKKNSLNNGS
jgi:hypothetical protein